MQKQIIKTVPIHSGVSPEYLESVITADVSLLDSLFDLIDNSIDAARDCILVGGHETDIYGLPASYQGYKIHIRLGQKNICIVDNCLGIEEKNLSDNVFITAGESEHPFGIGHYGVGLKRALLKFGNNYAMSTDNGKMAFQLKFNNANISGNTSFEANAYKSTGRRKTLFLVYDLKPNISYELDSLPWFESALEKLSQRYAIYISKGLSINVSSVHHKKFVKINSRLPKTRKSKYPLDKKHISVDGVDIYIEAGVHQEYFFPVEDKHSLSKNKKLTKDFGLYFICNDRVIVTSSKAREHGWEASWHSEYNGFLCFVRFVSEHSEKMPWNTAKTALRTDTNVFIRVREKLQPIADNYRSKIKKLYPPSKDKDTVKKPEESLKPSSTTQPTSSSGKPATLLASTTKVSNYLSAKDNESKHVKNWETLLPTDFPISEDDILNAYVLDACRLRISEAPCAAAMLLRVVLEKSLKCFVRKMGKFSEVKSHYYSKGEGKKKNHTDEYKKSQDLSLAMMLDWLKDDSVALDIFGAQDKAILLLATKKAAENTKKLNGLMHGLSLFSTEQTSLIRNEIYELLKFLVVKISPQAKK